MLFLSTLFYLVAFLRVGQFGDSLPKYLKHLKDN